MLHHGSGLSFRWAKVRDQVAEVKCGAGELEPGCFGLAVKVGGQGAVEGFEFGQVYLDAVVDGIFEFPVGKTAESWKSPADSICVVVILSPCCETAYSYRSCVYRVSSSRSQCRGQRHSNSKG